MKTTKFILERKVPKRTAFGRVFNACLGLGCLILFVWCFLAPNYSVAEIRFKFFHVNTSGFAGADSRNIQVAASCGLSGSLAFTDASCSLNAVVVKRLYPQATVRKLNYPSIWVSIYGAFEDNSEAFFRGFYTLNAMAGACLLLVLSARTNIWLFPCLLFSPVFLMGVERGNTDLLVLLLCNIPYLFRKSSSVAFNAISIGIATALKIFPIFILGAIASINGRNRIVATLIVTCSTLLISGYSFAQLPLIFRNASTDNQGASIIATYGLPSILNLPPEFSRFRSSILVAVLTYVVVTILLIGVATAKKKWSDSLRKEIGQIGNQDVCLTSSALFVGTFLTAPNYDYRLLCLAPLVCVASQYRSRHGRFLFVALLCIFWVPLVKRGWVLENLLCYLLFPCVCIFAILVYQDCRLNRLRQPAYPLEQRA